MIGYWIGYYYYYYGIGMPGLEITGAIGLIIFGGGIVILLGWIPGRLIYYYTGIDTIPPGYSICESY